MVRDDAIAEILSRPIRPVRALHFELGVNSRASREPVEIVKGARCVGRAPPLLRREAETLPPLFASTRVGAGRSISVKLPKIHGLSPHWANASASARRLLSQLCGGREAAM
jgi:hypothetical protein